MKNRIISLLCAIVMLFSFYSFMIPVHASETGGEIIEGSDIPLRLWYDEEAAHGIDKGYDNADRA